jgi:ferredoxin
LEANLTHVVTDSCIRCKYTDCVDVCPVDCFHEGALFLAIDPHECIDCAVCVAECPVGAIYADTDVPPDMEHFGELNRSMAAAWPVIRKRREPLPDAGEWAQQRNKLVRFDVAGGMLPPELAGS